MPESILTPKHLAMTESPKTESDNEFLDAASHDEERGLIAEFVGFMSENKAWWMTPILVVLGLVGVLFVLGATGIAPFIYTLF